MNYRERHKILADAFDRSENEVVPWDEMIDTILSFCMERGWQVHLDQNVVRIITTYGYVSVRHAGGVVGAILDAVALALREMRPGAGKSTDSNETTHLWGE